MKSLSILTLLLAAAFGWLTYAAPAAMGSMVLAAEQDCAKSNVKVSVALPGSDKCVGEEGNPIIEYIRGLIKFLSGAFGLVVVLMIIISGVQYMTSQGNPEQTKTAKNRLTNAITGLILFIMMYGILEYLIPGNIWG